MAELIDEKAKYIIGIDLGGTNIKGAFLDRDGHTLEKISITTNADKGAQVVIARILHVIDELIQWAEVDKSHIAGIGIGVPGQIDYDRGEVLFAPNLGWRNVFITDEIARATGLPVYLDNDGNVAALGEMWCGAGKGYSDIIALTIGTGIGGGIILRGKVLRGITGSAGEVGHMIMQENGPLCNCGKRGCLETLSSASAILRKARESIENSKKTSLVEYSQLEAKDIFKAAESGDQIALDIINESARWLGIAIANLINVLNPQLVVIGGGVARAGDILINPIRRVALENALEVAAKAVKIVPAQLGNDAGCIGAGALVTME